MARNWKGMQKAAEECGELVVELMKLSVFPHGKHPARRRSLVLSTEDECADVLAAVEYFIDRNSLDRSRIEKRKRAKYNKFQRWWGETKPKGIKKKIAQLKRVLKADKTAPSGSNQRVERMTTHKTPEKRA